MPQLNIPGAGHAGPAAVAGWQWLPFANAMYRDSVRRAIRIINTRVNGHRPCDVAFQALPGGRTFADVWADPSIWISYDPGIQANRFGATLGTEITLTQYSCRMGHWTIVATLIHELAHVNGADGASHDAEGVLMHCLMQGHHNPAIMGQLRDTPRDPVLMALHRSRGEDIA
jgi:hypothetical protein